MEKIQKAFLNINWPDLDLEGTKSAAHFLMNQWTYKAKVPAYKRKVDAMTSKDEIMSFMWNATERGRKIKSRFAYRNAGYGG